MRFILIFEQQFFVLLTCRCRSERTSDDFDLCFLKTCLFWISEAFTSLSCISEAGSAALHPKPPRCGGCAGGRSLGVKQQIPKGCLRGCKMQNALCNPSSSSLGGFVGLTGRIFSGFFLILCFRPGLFSKASSRRVTKPSRPRGRRGSAAP